MVPSEPDKEEEVRNFFLPHLVAQASFKFMVILLPQQSGPETTNEGLKILRNYFIRMNVLFICVYVQHVCYVPDT